MADTRKFVQAQKFQLAGSGVSSTDTSITLRSFTTPDETALTMTDFGTLGVGTLEPNTTREEIISFTGVTQNGDGTATLTGVTRGLRFVDPYTQDTALRQAHAGGTTFIISDNPQMFADFANKGNDESITGYWTVPDPVSSTDIANKQWVLTQVNGGAVSFEKVVVAGTAGETIAAGNLVYLKLADGKWWKTDADDSTTLYAVQLGIAQGSGTANNPITGGVLINGIDANNTGTAGAIAYASNTGGALSTSPGTFTRAVGNYKPSSGGLYFYPDLFLVSSQEVSANYAADSVGTDSYAITLSPAPGSYVTGMMVSFKAGTANTGAATLNINSLGAKTIKKNYNEDLITGDILANQISLVVYDGTNFQLVSGKNLLTPTVQVFTGSSTTLGDTTSQFDITNPAGSTYRYTWDGTGTDPGITSGTVPTGTPVLIASSSLNSSNVGNFIVTASGTNYFEVTNSSGTVEVNKTLANGYLKKINAQTYTTPTGLKYAIVEAVGAGASGGSASSDGQAFPGGGAGGYSKKIISSTTLGSSQTLYVGVGGVSSISHTEGRVGASTLFGSILTCNGGGKAIDIGGGYLGGIGGTSSGGDINIQGGDGHISWGNSSAPGISVGGNGGASYFGGGGYGGYNDEDPANGRAYGSGGGGAGAQSSSSLGGAGADGVVIVTEYYQ